MSKILDRTAEEESKLLNKMINKLKNDTVFEVRNLGDKIRDYRNGRKPPVMKPLSLYCDCIGMLETNIGSYMKRDYPAVIEYAERIYRDIFPYYDETPDFEERAAVFLALFGKTGIIRRRAFDITLFNLFNNPDNYIKWAQSLSDEKDIVELRAHYLPYAVAARSYFPDEDMFTANIILVTGKLMVSPNPSALISEEIKKIEHMAGIYNVDEATVLRAEQNIRAAKDVVERSAGMLSEIDTRIKAIDEISNAATERVKDMCEGKIAESEAMLNGIDTKLKNAYDSFAESQKKSLVFDKQLFINDVVAEAQVQLNDLKKTAQMIVSSARLELTKLNRESDNTMTKLDTLIKNDDKLKQLMDSANEKNDLVEKLEKLSILNTKNIEAMSDSMDKASHPLAAGSVSFGAPQIVIPSDASQPEDFEDIPGINPLLDDSVNFRERYKRVMEEKKKMELAGEHFHSVFDDVLMAVMENANPYLIGPSGCGKTFMVGQIAKLLNMEFIDIGYINEEYDILGFQTANGGYSRPNFYRCFKYGKIAFCDELDNGNSRATVKLNAFLSNTSHGSYNFPNGERVPRHNNFRIIGAGNTAGNGADSVYNTREKIEESVQQRFTPIYVNYDNNVEKAILGKYNAWFEFVVAFRNATNAWSRNSHSEAAGIITTRDVTRIKRYIDNGSFNLDKILDYEFVQTKDETYLAFLAQQISQSIKSGNPAEAIARRFVSKVDAIRNGSVIR